MEKHFTYILQNPDNILYKGYTTDIVKRINQHNNSFGKYTSEKGLWKLVYKKRVLNKKISSD